MEYLLTHRTHPTVDEIFTALYPSMPTLSKTTVYNTLKLFVEHGAALALDIDPRNTHFDGDISAHAHFLCRSCGRIYDLPLGSQPDVSVAPDGFEIAEMQVYYKGCCVTCNRKLD